MTETDSVTLTRSEYDALIARTEELEDTLAARLADDGSRIPHEVALAIMDGERPVVAYRRHRRLTLRQLAARTGLAVGYLSEIERGLKPGSTSALSRIADAVGTTIDTLVRLD
ncbi:MAG: helix-turn-helix transcriptional regulator [Acidobacteria bacterium]|nr:helix-turn-helix transcriptional regulator [Acidobacteriota bacterium]